MPSREALVERAERDHLLITRCLICGNVKAEAPVRPGCMAGVSDGLDEACVPAYVEKYGFRRTA